MTKTFKEIITQAVIILFFIAISFAYFSPIIQGKVIKQMDYEHAQGVGHEATTYHNAENRDIAWTNSLFGGMPTYQIGGLSNKNIYRPIRVFLTHFLPYTTVSTLFLYLLGFYILLLTFKVNKWVSVIGALAFALSSYNIIIIAAGHITKTYAIAFMPIVLAGFIQIYDKKYWLGIILTILGLGLQVSTSHIQIIYYTGLTVGLYVIFRFFWDFKDKKLKDFALSSAIAFVVAIISILPNTGTLWRANEMGKYSIRGKSEITLNKDANQGDGLDKDYALAWSYGVGESFSLMIPNIKGGGSAYLGSNDVAMSKIDAQYKDMISQQSQYWGEQPFTSGPVYLGAIVMFLFVLGMFIVKDKIKWWLLTATILSIILSWGKNFGFVTDFFFNYFPYYNKFRTVSMTLVIASFTVPFMAFLTLKEIIKDKTIIKNNLKYFGIAFGLTGGLALIFWLIPGFFNFLTTQESKYFNDLMAQAPAQKSQINAFIEQLKIARIAVFKADAIRSFAYILLSAAVIFFYSVQAKIKDLTFIFILGFLILADMWTIDRRYLSNDDFVSKSTAKQVFAASPADQFINKDIDPYYRVLNLSTSTFNDAFTSYFHNSIGGYHGAKLRRYQDVIDYYLSPSIQQIGASFQDTTISYTDVLPRLQVLNMLNTKYIIYNPNAAPIPNMNAFGNAWFADNFKFVETADDEITSLGTENLKRTAIINKNKFDVTKLAELSYSNDSTRRITLTTYEPDRLVFDETSKNGGFIVFSDIYYPKGWTATIDGTETPIYQTNYILRGLQVPPGSHKITFEFRPAAVFVAKKIEIASSFLVAILLLVGLFFIYKKNKNSSDNLKETK